MTHIATKRQFSRNLTSGWVLLLAEVAVAFLLTPFIIQRLGAAAYGVWSLMISVVGYMGLIDIGIRGSVGRYINHYMALKDERAVTQVVGTASVVLSGLGLLVLVASFVMAHYFSVIFPKTPQELGSTIRFCLPLMAVGLWLAFISSILGNLLAAKEALYLNNNYSLLLLVLRAAATFWVLGAGFGMAGLMAVTTGFALVGFLIFFRLAQRLLGDQMPSLTAFSVARLREMWRYGIASFVSRSAGTMANDAAPIIGMWLLGPEAVAVYSVGLTLSQYAKRLLDQVNAAIFPSVMKAGAIKDMAGQREIFLRFMGLSFAIGSLVFIGVAVFSGDFFALWVGEQYRAAGVVTGILVIGYLLQSVASTGPIALASLDRIDVTVKISIAEAVGCIVLTFLLPWLGMGIAGMALGATLPRFLFGCLVYPWLVVAVLGQELKRPLWRKLRENTVLCTVVWLAFYTLHRVLPGSSWLNIVISGAIATLGHVLLLGHRYEAFPGIERLNARLGVLTLRFFERRRS